jgi:hypothetical protein
MTQNWLLAAGMPSGDRSTTARAWNVPSPSRVGVTTADRRAGPRTAPLATKLRRNVSRVAATYVDCGLHRADLRLCRWSSLAGVDILRGSCGCHSDRDTEQGESRTSQGEPPTPTPFVCAQNLRNARRRRSGRGSLLRSPEARAGCDIHLERHGRHLHLAGRSGRQLRRVAPVVRRRPRRRPAALLPPLRCRRPGR